MESLRQTKARIWAECGGMMYLSEGIDDTNMTGLLPFRTTMQGARLHLGYRSMMVNGKELRGHVFHYSSMMGTPPSSAIQLFDAQGQPVETEFYIYDKIYAGYTHWLYPLIT
jgi:cobyrinic acid a,c-diamide synthase